MPHKEIPLYEAEIPILKEETVQSYSLDYKDDNIEQYQYVSTNGNGIYSYIKINGINYNLGQLSTYDDNTNAVNGYVIESVNILEGYKTYKQRYASGALVVDYRYIKIVDNVPYEIMKLQNTSEYKLSSNKNDVTIASYGTFPTAEIYLWNENKVLNIDLSGVFPFPYVVVFDSDKQRFEVSDTDKHEISYYKLKIDGENIYLVKD